MYWSWVSLNQDKTQIIHFLIQPVFADSYICKVWPTFSIQRLSTYDWLLFEKLLSFVSITSVNSFSSIIWLLPFKNMGDSFYAKNAGWTFLEKRWSHTSTTTLMLSIPRTGVRHCQALLYRMLWACLLISNRIQKHIARVKYFHDRMTPCLSK